MNLAEWCEKYDRHAQLSVKDGFDPMMCVRDRFNRPRQEGWDLHHLSDYVVTAVEAGTVWLAVRRNPVP